MQNKEMILCAALYYNDNNYHQSQPVNVKKGFVLCGRRHHNCYYTLSQIAGRDAWSEAEQGFLTSYDRFVDRQEANKIAFCSGQINMDLGTLMSEDLY